MLKNGEVHKDLGGNYFNKRSPEVQAKRLAAQLKKLGYEVSMQPIARAA